MPFIYSAQPTRHTPTAVAMKQGRHSLESEFAVEEQLPPVYPGSEAWDAMVAEDEGRWDDDTEDSDDDFTTQTRLPRMSFNGRPYLPIPPDASTLARPVDDWFTQPVERFPQSSPKTHHPMCVPSFQHCHADLTQYDAYLTEKYPTEYPSDRTQHVNPLYLGSHEQIRSSSPCYEYPPANPMAYRAPILHPRHVQLAERPFTPQGTYRYTASHPKHIFVSPMIEKPTKEAISNAFATWYVEQVVSLLAVPGLYRSGTGGASNETWGSGGRERDGWLRVGRAPPDYSKPWGRMGMTSTPLQMPRKSLRRCPGREPHDPWNVLWNNDPIPSATLVTFVLDMVQRMTIAPIAIVSAVWYLTGVGLHDGDGAPGAGLREFLRDQKWSDLEAVEKRVAALGLLLAGKWLDDNSFLTKSWSEVTLIPTKEIDRMERAALQELHFSLHIPIPSWADHVNKSYASLYTRVELNDFDLIVLQHLDGLVTDARSVELHDPASLAATPDYDRCYSAQELPAAADQTISRDWGSFARNYSINDKDYHSTYRVISTPRSHAVDVDMAMAERTVSALVDDDTDEEEFLDYDGAQRWLPSLSDQRRLATQSIAQSVDMYPEVDHWRSAVGVDSRDSRPTSPGIPLAGWDDSLSWWPKNAEPSGPFTDDPRLVLLYQTELAAKKPFVPSVHAPFAQTSPWTQKDSVVYLEPGISVIRPPAHRHSGHKSSAKGWDSQPPRW